MKGQSYIQEREQQQKSFNDNLKVVILERGGELRKSS